ncbi:hypothetical protein WA026_016968 [Henosepilachna vigintioctopunctata]|uniref:Uncharacterized protein n=1 Tax=Henosepilachna vigintioctopunctata TaxID=420089 RepID=A0AAW1UAZ9_9CUCU
MGEKPGVEEGLTVREDASSKQESERNGVEGSPSDPEDDQVWIFCIPKTRGEKCGVNAGQVERICRTFEEFVCEIGSWGYFGISRPEIFLRVFCRYFVHLYCKNISV